MPGATEHKSNKPITFYYINPKSGKKIDLTPYCSDLIFTQMIATPDEAWQKWGYLDATFVSSPFKYIDITLEDLLPSKHSPLGPFYLEIRESGGKYRINLPMTCNDDLSLRLLMTPPGKTGTTVAGDTKKPIRFITSYYYVFNQTKASVNVPAIFKHIETFYDYVKKYMQTEIGFAIPEATYLYKNVSTSDLMQHKFKDLSVIVESSSKTSDLSNQMISANLKPKPQKNQTLIKSRYGKPIEQVYKNINYSIDFKQIGGGNDKIPSVNPIIIKNTYKQNLINKTQTASNFVNQVGQNDTNIFNNLTNLVNNICSEITGFINGIGNEISGFLSGLTNLANDIVNAIGGLVSEVAGTIGSIIGAGGGLLNSIINMGNAIANAVNNFLNSFSACEGSIVNTIKSLVNNLLSQLIALKNLPNLIISTLINDIKSAINSILSQINNLINLINTFLGNENTSQTPSINPLRPSPIPKQPPSTSNGGELSSSFSSSSSSSNATITPSSSIYLSSTTSSSPTSTSISPSSNSIIPSTTSTNSGTIISTISSTSYPNVSITDINSNTISSLTTTPISGTINYSLTTSLTYLTSDTNIIPDTIIPLIISNTTILNDPATNNNYIGYLHSPANVIYPLHTVDPTVDSNYTSLYNALYQSMSNLFYDFNQVNANTLFYGLINKTSDIANDVVNDYLIHLQKNLAASEQLANVIYNTLNQILEATGLPQLSTSFSYNENITNPTSSFYQGLYNELSQLLNTLKQAVLTYIDLNDNFYFYTYLGNNLTDLLTAGSYAGVSVDPLPFKFYVGISSGEAYLGDIYIQSQPPNLIGPLADSFASTKPFIDVYRYYKARNYEPASVLGQLSLFLNTLLPPIYANAARIYYNPKSQGSEQEVHFNFKIYPGEACFGSPDWVIPLNEDAYKKAKKSYPHKIADDHLGNLHLVAASPSIPEGFHFPIQISFDNQALITMDPAAFFLDCVGGFRSDYLTKSLINLTESTGKVVHVANGTPYLVLPYAGLANEFTFGKWAVHTYYQSKNVSTFLKVGPGDAIKFVRTAEHHKDYQALSVFYLVQGKTILYKNDKTEEVSVVLHLCRNGIGGLSNRYVFQEKDVTMSDEMAIINNLASFYKEIVNFYKTYSKSYKEACQMDGTCNYHVKPCNTRMICPR